MTNLARKIVDDKNYGKLKAQKLTIDAREKSGETINKDSTKELTKKLGEVEKKTNIVDKATSIKALVDMKD
ncbi:hypothetical protein, partial [Streptobacillus notomytis]|uniref:hypothetical protein n=1 Tax=Streptobacillus notomytis TaxID=1712031 RepID=UPI000AA4F84C